MDARRGLRAEIHSTAAYAAGAPRAGMPPPALSAATYAPTYTFDAICKQVDNDACIMNTLTLAGTVVGVVGLLVVLVRIVPRRCGSHRSALDSGSIAQLIEDLVIWLCVCDMLYYLDIAVFVMDANAPSVSMVLSRRVPRWMACRTLAYSTIREGFAMLCLFLHGSIAYSLYAWVCLKQPVSRIRARQRILFPALFAAAVTVARMAMQTLGGNLWLMVSMISFSGVLVPVTMAFLLRWYLLTAKKLFTDTQPGIRFMEAWCDFLNALCVSMLKGTGCKIEEPTTEASEAGKALHVLEQEAHEPVEDVEAGRGITRTGSQDRDRPVQVISVVRRLVHISLIISIVWLLHGTIDVVVWANFSRPHPRTYPQWVYFFRLVLKLITGWVDAVVFGGLFTCSRTGEESTDRDSVVEAKVSDESEMPSLSAHPKLASSKLSSTTGGKESTGSLVTHAAIPVPCEDIPLPSPLKLKKLWRTKSSGGGGSSGSDGHVQEPQATRPGIVSVLASTWNMGAISAAELTTGLTANMLNVWLPNGYDLYVIGVQECMCFAELATLIHDHLGGPTAYHVHTRFLSEYLRLPSNGVIGVMAFARSEDVSSGAFSVHKGGVDAVAAGVNLGPMGRACNKGMVGISARYFDCSMALMNVHFAADLQGRSRLSKRNEDARTTLTELQLHGSTEFDVHHQHDISLLVGDVNYRLTGTSSEVLTNISKSAAREAASVSRANDDSGEEGGCCAWRRESLAKLQRTHVCAASSGSAPQAPKRAWDWVPAIDEATAAMASHDVLHGFSEQLPVAFPPSYRWRYRGQAGDYTDVQSLQAKAYTTAVVFQNAPSPDASLHSTSSLEELPGDVVHCPVEEVESASSSQLSTLSNSSNRTPSYTDRVLTHTLPSKRNAVRWIHYDMIDLVNLSDHRPVAAAMEIQVDRAVRGFQLDDPSVKRSSAITRSISSMPRSDVARFTIYIGRPRLELRVPGEGIARAAGLSELIVMFPVTAEDALAMDRQAELLHEAVPGVSKQVSSTASNASMSSASFSWFSFSSGGRESSMQSGGSRKVRHGSAIKHFSRTAFPAKHVVMASTRFSQHILIKAISSTRNPTAGQGVVQIHPYVEPKPRRARIELSQGGALVGWIHLELRVKCVADG